MEINVNKSSGIYCIKNTINNKMYVGSSVNMHTRLTKHRSLLDHKKHENRYLSNSWSKNGRDNFKCYVLEECDKDFLIEREQYWIDLLNPDYNLIKIVKGNMLSKESCRMISDTLKEGYKSGRLKPTRTSSVDCYDLKINYICTYKMIRDASDDLKISESLICRVLNGTYEQAKGHVFTYEGEKPSLPGLSRGPQGHKILFKSEDEELSFLSFGKAAKYFKVSVGNLHYQYKKNKSWKQYQIVKV